MTKKKRAASSSLKPSSVEEVGNNMPSLHTLWNDRSIQDQIQDRLRELSGVDKKGTDLKIKSQRGGSVDIFVKERVKWSHEYVLAGNTKDRITYNQLNITQFMAGFCRIMKEENCQVTKDHMLDYLIALLDDSNNFSLQAAKASHAVLLCCMEQGKVTSWLETDKINRIGRANAQRHVVPTQSNSGSQKFRKKSGSSKIRQVNVSCVYDNDNSCNFNKNHKTKGVFYCHICSSCFAQDGKVNAHSAQDCKQKRVSLGMVNTAQLQPDYVQDQVPDENFSSQYSCRYVYNSSVKQSILVNEFTAKNLHGKNGLVTAIVLNL